MWYDSLGVDVIAVATTDIGGYAWARHGFTWTPRATPEARCP
jgi:hypothetical protein